MSRSPTRGQRGNGFRVDARPRRRLRQNRQVGTGAASDIVATFGLPVDPSDLAAVRGAIIERIKLVTLESPLAPSLTAALRQVEEAMQVSSTELVPVRAIVPEPRPQSVSNDPGLRVDRDIARIRRRYRRKTIPVGAITALIGFVWSLPAEATTNPLLNRVSPWERTGLSSYNRIYPGRFDVWLLVLAILALTWVRLVARRRFEERAVTVSSDPDVADDAMRALRATTSDQEPFTESMFRHALVEATYAATNVGPMRPSAVVDGPLARMLHTYGQGFAIAMHELRVSFVVGFRRAARKPTSRADLVRCEIGQHVREPSASALDRYCALGWIRYVGHNNFEPSYAFEA